MTLVNVTLSLVVVVDLNELRDLLVEIKFLVLLTLIDATVAFGCIIVSLFG